MDARRATRHALRDDGNVHVSTISAGWRKIAVLAGNGERCRFFLLEPSQADNELIFEGFYVRGCFVIAEKVNHMDRARDLDDVRA